MVGFLFYLSPDRDTLRSPFSCGDGIDRLLSWKNSAMRYLAFAGMFLVCAAPCAAAVITLGASADAFVATGPANELAGLNYGDASSLMVAGANGGQGVFKTVVRFNTSNVKAHVYASLPGPSSTAPTPALRGFGRTISCSPSFAPAILTSVGWPMTVGRRASAFR